MIRQANMEDLAAINTIFNQLIETSTAVWEQAPISFDFIFSRSRLVFTALRLMRTTQSLVCFLL
ncbi:MAG: GNAT family N-acetyltransferase [Bacillota bacterium]